MAIKKANELDYANKKMSIIIQGSPGVGKTTLAQSAPKVLTIDADNGMCRVKPQHRQDASVCSTFDEVKADIEAAKGQYETIVIDTGGALIEMMKQYVVDNPKDFKGGAKATGGISLQGFGFVKTLWNDFTADLRRNFNVVVLFHESAERNGDDGTFYQIVCEGSTRNTVYQSADLAARLFINNGQRYLGFTPTEQYSAKACFGISGLVQVPELKDGDPNDFLTKLFAKVRKNLEEETKSLNKDQGQYQEIMEAVQRICEGINSIDDAQGAMDAFNSLPHVLTSKKEGASLINKRLRQIGVRYDKPNGRWVLIEQS
jgi:hypothetical protein